MKEKIERKGRGNSRDDEERGVGDRWGKGDVKRSDEIEKEEMRNKKGKGWKKGGKKRVDGEISIMKLFKRKKDCERKRKEGLRKEEWKGIERKIEKGNGDEVKMGDKRIELREEIGRKN